MTIPATALLAFAAWTLLTVGTTHGFYRLGRILTGRSEISEFGAYRLEGEKGWYVRGMRAHANCVENLGLFGAIVFAAWALDVDTTTLDVLSCTVIAARIPHTLVHVLFEQTNKAVAARSILFNIQWIAMASMCVVVALGS